MVYEETCSLLKNINYEKLLKLCMYNKSQPLKWEFVLKIYVATNLDSRVLYTIKKVQIQVHSKFKFVSEHRLAIVTFKVDHKLNIT